MSDPISRRTLLGLITLTLVTAGPSRPTVVGSEPALWVLERRDSGLWLQRIRTAKRGVLNDRPARVVAREGLRGLDGYLPEVAGADRSRRYLAVWWVDARLPGALDELGTRPPTLMVIDHEQRKVLLSRREPGMEEARLQWSSPATLRAEFRAGPGDDPKTALYRVSAHGAISLPVLRRPAPHEPTVLSWMRRQPPWRDIT